MIPKGAIPYAATVDFRSVTLPSVNRTPFLPYLQIISLTSASIHLLTVHFDLRYQFPFFFYICGCAMYTIFSSIHVDITAVYLILTMYMKKKDFYPRYFVIPPFGPLY